MSGLCGFCNNIVSSWLTVDSCQKSFTIITNNDLFYIICGTTFVLRDDFFDATGLCDNVVPGFLE